MIRRLTVATVAAAALSLALAGCGKDSVSGSSSGSGSGSGSGAGSSSGGSAVDWAEKVCKSIEPDVLALTQTPDIDPADMQKTKDSMVAFLGKFSTALDHMATSLKDAGDPPVASGKQDVEKLSNALGSAKQAVDQARSNLDKASASDPAAFQAAFAKVGEDLSKLDNLEDPTKSLEANKELKDAFEQAPTCKKIDMGSGSSSSTPTS